MNSISPNITNKIEISDDEIITVEEIGKWLNLSSGMVTLQSELIQELINTTIQVVEDYTWRFLRRTTFEAYYNLSGSNFNLFTGGCLKLGLERSPIIALSDISKVEYLDTDGIWQEFDKGSLSSEGIYENVTEKKEQRGYASIYFKEAIPFDSSRFNAYKVRITFIAGYAIDVDTTTNVPVPIKTAIKMIVAAYYTNRGDCSSGCSLNGFAVPCAAKSIIDQYSLARTTFGGSYTPTGDNCGF